MGRETAMGRGTAMARGRGTRRGRRLLAVAATGGLVLTAAGCDLGEEPVAYPGLSWDLRAGDLDGDGDVDLLAIDPGRAVGNGTTTLLNDGDGTFTTTAETGVVQGDVQLGDLDGDGVLDRLALRTDAGVAELQLRRGDGDGGFGPGERLATPTAASGLHLADLDGDGAVDAITEEDDGLVVRLNDGAGGLGAPTTYGSTLRSWRMRVGDATGDDVPDVVVLTVVGEADTGAPAVLVVPGDGDGGLLPPLAPVVIGTPGRYEVPADLAVGDVDEDGHPDVVAAVDGGGGNRRLVTVPGDGAGGSEAPVPTPLTASLEDVVLADIDGDGHLDAVTTRNTDRMGDVHHGDGAGRFVDTHPIGTDDIGTIVDVVAVPLDEGPTVDVAFATYVQGGGSANTVVLLNTLEGRDHG